ncbi:MAG: hypothetical protein ACR2L0_03940 [Gaiellaceae bacterium]
MAFEELKTRQSVMWEAAPFERIASTLADMHDAVVERLAPRSSAEAGWDEHSTAFGPAKTLLDSLDDDSRGELGRNFVEMLRSHSECGRIRLSRTYLLVLGRRR